jgi:hypothetical protein
LHVIAALHSDTCTLPATSVPPYGVVISDPAWYTPVGVIQTYSPPIEFRPEQVPPEAESRYWPSGIPDVLNHPDPELRAKFKR